MTNKEINIILPKDVDYILYKLKENGYEGYVVGGCVRDSILNRPIHDWDITTNAKPKEILNIFKYHKTILTGIKHGTVTVIIDENCYEITTYRIDGEYEDGRHPNEVNFTNNLKQDLARRDFTINAMAYNREEGLIDYFNGLEDLKNRIIKCVGNPHDRFKEDALRILRGIRFSAQLNFKIDKTTMFYMESASLNNISIERIREEFNKTLLTNNKEAIEWFMLIVLYLRFKVYIYMLYTKQKNPYHIYNLFEHSLYSTLAIQQRLDLRLTMLLHDLGKVETETTDNGINHYYGHSIKSVDKAKEILKYMKYDNKTIDKVCTLIKYHDFMFDDDDRTIKKQIKRLLNKIGEDNFRDLLKVKLADILSQNPFYAKDRIKQFFKIEDMLEEILKDKDCFKLKELNINGNELINIGYSGKEIGYILNVLLEKVIDGLLENKKETLINYVKEHKKEFIKIN